MQRPAVLLAAAFACAAGPAAAAPDEAADIAREVSAFIAVAESVRAEYEGPSPTLLARRLLDRKEKAVQAVLKEAWDRASVAGSPAAERETGIARVVRFLYGLEGPAAGPVPDKDRISFGNAVGLVHESGGIVLVRPGGTGRRGKVMGEPGWNSDEPEPRPRFEALVKGGKWRKPVRADPRKTLERLLAIDAEKWTDDEKRCFAMGAGEVLGADPSFLAKLLKEWEDAPTDEALGRAVAWAGAPAAVEALRARIAPLVARVTEGKEAALPLLQVSFRGLRRSAPAVLAAEIGRLEGEVREAALLGAGFRTAAPILAAEYEKAPDAAGRTAAFHAMVRLILKASFARELPGPADMPRVVRILLAEIEGADGESRRWAEQGSYGLFYMGMRDGTANVSFSSNDVSVKGTGDRLGPYPDMGPILRKLDEDLAAGNLVPSEDEAGLFDRSSPSLAADGPAWTGFQNPQPNWVEAKKDAPVQLRSEPVKGGLKVTLVNAGAKPFAVNPVALRYVCAEYIPVTVTGPGAKSFTQLTLDLGFLGGWSSWTVPARVLVTLKPGETCSFDVPIRTDHETVDHVGVSIRDSMRVPEGSPVPVLRNLATSWLR